MSNTAKRIAKIEETVLDILADLGDTDRRDDGFYFRRMRRELIEFIKDTPIEDP